MGDIIINKPSQPGILLINLGTPSQATPAAVKTYLAEFLTDRHVIDLPSLLWYPLLFGLILPRRIKPVSHYYQEIWTPNGSPLYDYTQSLAHQLQLAYPDTVCEIAMTYGEPSLAHALQKLRNCCDINVIFLFPQYSTTTTLAAQDKLEQLRLAHPNTQLRLNYLSDYADHPSYISALCQTIERTFEQHGVPDVLLLSYHGIPIRYITQRQDRYAERCQTTTDLISQQLHNKGYMLDIQTSYQSRFGKGKWTEPDTEQTLLALAASNKKHVQICCPGFAVDCIETLHEVAIRYQATFLAKGGIEYHYIPALNDSHEQVTLMQQLIAEMSACET